MNTLRRIGFACKISALNAKQEIEAIPEYNCGGTTITWLNRQPRHVAEEKLWDLMVNNIASVKNAVEYIGSLDESLRLFRIGSDILSAYTHDDWRYFYQRTDVRDYCERHLARVGEIARSHNVRLSFHPGQFTVLASDNPDIVRRSIEEFEYHADMIRWMGYGQKFQDFKCNVHIAGRLGADGIRAVYPQLSTEARNTITIENEEMKHGLVDCLSIADIVPIVLDIHHNWIREGTYINANSEEARRVIDSWRGVRPTCHYSVSREDVLVAHDATVRPNHQLLLETGYKKSKLRAHSDFYWNTACNDWALTFLESFDIMCESKAKNLASFALHQRAKELELV